LREKHFVWMTILIAGLILGLWQSLANATEIEYIPKEKRASLHLQFENAKPMSTVKGAWTCDIYGMRTNLQVIHNLKLYDFSPALKTTENRGAQIVQVYENSKGEMSGKTDKVVDQLRASPKGELVSKLTDSHSGDVIAYSVCHSS
jgi:hypothetical protein